MPRLLAAAAAVLVAFALWFSFGTFAWAPLALVTLAALASLAALVSADSEAPRLRLATGAVLALGVAGGVAAQLLVLEGDRRAPPHHPYFVSLGWVAIATLLAYGLPRPPRWVARGRFPLLVVCFGAMAVVAFRTERLPFVDSWLFRQQGAQALLQGQNPYELVFPNIYGHERFYGPGFLKDGKVTVYPYPPLQILADVPFLEILGDVRWTMLAAAIAAALLVARLGSRPESELAALLVLFQPRMLYVAKVSWTEPVVLAAWAAALAALRRWRARAPRGALLAGLGGGLLLAAKQYAPLLALPLAAAAPRPGARKAALAASAIAAATVVPFALWNAGELWHDLAVAQVLQPFRMDALSWLAAWARWRGGTPPSAAFGFVAAALALALGLRRRPDLLRGALTAATAFLMLVLFNKQAFCNYYWLAAGLLASASVLEDGSPLHAEAKAAEAGSLRAGAGA